MGSGSLIQAELRRDPKGIIPETLDWSCPHSGIRSASSAAHTAHEHLGGAQFQSWKPSREPTRAHSGQGAAIATAMQPATRPSRPSMQLAKSPVGFPLGETERTPLGAVSSYSRLARLLTGMPRRWATAVQVSPSAKKRATASSFYCGVNRRRARFGLFIDGQRGGHGVSLIDLSTKPGQPRLD